MSYNAGNIVVGGSELVIGSGVPTTDANGIFSEIDADASGTPKDFRAWARAQDGGSALSTTGVTFRHAGLTTEGVSIAYNPEYGEVTVDQLLDAARLFKTKVNVTVKTSFAEATLENLVYVWDMADTNLTTNGDYKTLQLVGGELGDAPKERVVFFVGQGPQIEGVYSQRCYLNVRGISMQSSEHALKRDGETVFPVEFRVLPDTSASLNPYGIVVDQV